LALRAYALREARQAFERGDFAGALDWLANVRQKNGEARTLECEVRYRYGAELAAQGQYDAAETQFARASGGGCSPAALIQDRVRLLRNHNASIRDLVGLRSRFGTTCAACDGVDLYRLATCQHQQAPVPAATVLSPHMLRPVVQEVYAAGAYRPGWSVDRNDPLSVLARREKERIDRSSIRLLGALLGDYVRYHTPLAPMIDALVPVPTSLEREGQRGGGIPNALCITLQDVLALPSHELIVQAGTHLDHREADRTARRQSLRAVWRSKSVGHLKGRAVLVVDDILTTGTTMSTAAELLLEAGVGRVYGVALLHTERGA
jgi:predicted amidophosphoribosyltransferase